MQDSSIKTLAIITNATRKPAFELAKEFASRGHELLLCGPDEEVFFIQDKLIDLGIDSEALLIDFDKHKSVELLFETAKKLEYPIEVCLINHFELDHDSFSSDPLKYDINFINTNILSFVHIMKKLLLFMYKTGSGKIIIHLEKDFNSNSPLQNALYEFVHSFAKSLKEEISHTNIKIETLTKMRSWVEKFKSQYLNQ